MSQPDAAFGAAEQMPCPEQDRTRADAVQLLACAGLRRDDVRAESAAGFMQICRVVDTICRVVLHDHRQARAACSSTWSCS